MRDWFQASREYESMFMKPSPSLPLPVPSLSSPDETQTVAPQGNRITLERGEGITAIEAEAILDSICARAKAENSHEVYYPALTGLLKFHFTEMLQHPGYHLERLLRDHGYSIPPAPTTESSPVSSSLSYPPPESEWPEKPDAGEGMVWERCPRGWNNEEKVKWITLRFDIRRWCSMDEDSTCADQPNFITFRAIPAPVAGGEEPTHKEFLEVESVVKDSSTTDFPPVGTRLRFTVDGFFGCDDHKRGDEIIVENVSDRHFEAGGFGFSDDWRDGLEVVPPSDPEESRAKAALEDGWLWYGRGPLKSIADDVEALENVLSWWPEIEPSWTNDWSGNAAYRFYALRAGSPIAIANGLEPSPEWRELVTLEIIDSETEYRFSDIHVWIKGGSLVGTTVQKCVFEYGQQFRARRRVGTERGIQRWHPNGDRFRLTSMDRANNGEYILYTDHLAALKQAAGKEGV